jgi:transmembrane sensor
VVLPVGDDKLSQAQGGERQKPTRWTIFGREHFHKRLPVTIFRAASVAVALAAGALFLYSHLGLYSTGFGEQRTLTLADGSVVTLNTDSQIRVRLSDRVRRIELLGGEAFFRVAHYRARPFIVSAKDTVVRAVGTQFDVKIASRDTVVSVVEGRVKVSEETSARPEANALPVILERGEEARVGPPSELEGKDPRPVIIKESRTAALHAAAWTQGRLEFDTVPLSDVLAEFRRYRNFDVQINDETLRQLKLTGSFDAHDPDSALAYIATIPGVVVEKKNSNTYLIRHR